MEKKKGNVLATLAVGVVGAVATTVALLEPEKRGAMVEKGKEVIKSGKELGAEFANEVKGLGTELVDDAKNLGNEALVAGKGLTSTGLGHLQTGIGAIRDKLDGKPAKKPAVKKTTAAKKPAPAKKKS